MTTTTESRLFGWLPFWPLANYVGTRTRTDRNNHSHRLSTNASLLDAAGLHRNEPAGQRWEQRFRRGQQTGWLRINDAEDYCFLLGVHPMVVWGDAYFAANSLPEWEPAGTFGGKPLRWQSVGHARWYGLFG